MSDFYTIPIMLFLDCCIEVFSIDLGIEFKNIFKYCGVEVYSSKF